jgi:hypothetical protein
MFAHAARVGLRSGGFRTRGPIHFLTLTLSARADAVDAVVDVFDVIIPNRYRTRSAWRRLKLMILFIPRTPVRRRTRFAIDWLFVG